MNLIYFHVWSDSSAVDMCVDLSIGSSMSYNQYFVEGMIYVNFYISYALV